MILRVALPRKTYVRNKACAPLVKDGEEAQDEGSPRRSVAAELRTSRRIALSPNLCNGRDLIQSLALIFYVLLGPVNANIALLSALFRFAEAVIGSINVIWYVVPLVLLSGAQYLKAVEPQTIALYTYLSLKAYGIGLAIALIPFGITCILLGYLIVQSTYLPKTLGVLMTIAGACYVVNSFTLILAPAFADTTFIAVFVSALPAELGLTLWLLLKGVNLPKWTMALQARADYAQEAG